MAENEHSAQEIATFTSEQRMKEYVKAAKDAIQLLDLTNPPTKSYTVYSKSSLRTYLKNPLTDSNQKNLRQVSQFLYVLSAQYRRIVSYLSSQIDLTAYNVIPNVSMTEENDNEQLLQNYEKVLKWIERMNLAGQIFSMLVTAWREDGFFGYIYYDDNVDWDKNNLVVIPLDGNYCRVSSTNYDGTLNMAFDFSFFDGSNKVYLDYWDKEFTTMYNNYQKDSKLRWQELNPDRTFVLKVNYDQIDRLIPPLSSLFESIIDLIDLQSIVSEKDALSIYKLLIAQIDTLSSSKEPNSFAVDLNLAVDFYNKIASQLPESIGIALSPMKIEPITFEKDATDDTNQISNSNANLWEAAGVSQIMDTSRLTGATAVRFAMIFDGLYSMKPLLWQIEARVNRLLDFLIPDNKMRVKYMADVTPYTKSDKINQIKEAASLGLPVKTAYLTLMGISPLDGYALTYLENDILKLQDKWQYPLHSSYTQSATQSGNEGNLKDIGDLSDEGEETRDLDKNN